MKVKVYAMFTRLRSWDSVGEVHATEEERTASLRAFVEEIDPDVPDDASVSDLLEITAEHDHDVDLFDGEIEIDDKPARHADTKPAYGSRPCPICGKLVYPHHLTGRPAGHKQPGTNIQCSGGRK